MKFLGYGDVVEKIPRMYPGLLLRIEYMILNYCSR